MRKKVIILAAIVIIIPIVVAVVLNTGDKHETVKVDDMEISAGIEKSAFDDEGIVIEPDSSNQSKQKDAGKSNSNNTSTSSNEADDKDDSSDKANKDDSSGSSDKPAGGSDDKEMDYEKFHAMSPEKQQEYVESFKDIDAFFKWYNKAKKEYDKANPGIEIDGGAVELE